MAYEDLNSAQRWAIAVREAHDAQHAAGIEHPELPRYLARFALVPDYFIELGHFDLKLAHYKEHGVRIEPVSKYPILGEYALAGRPEDMYIDRLVGLQR